MTTTTTTKYNVRNKFNEIINDPFTTLKKDELTLNEINEIDKTLKKYRYIVFDCCEVWNYYKNKKKLFKDTKKEYKRLIDILRDNLLDKKDELFFIKEKEKKGGVKQASYFLRDHYGETITNEDIKINLELIEYKFKKITDKQKEKYIKNLTSSEVVEWTYKLDKGFNWSFIVFDIKNNRGVDLLKKENN